MSNSSTVFLRLLQLTDSALPIGSYSESFGLETLIVEGIICDTTTTRRAIESVLENSTVPLDATACAFAYRYEQSKNRSELMHLNELLTACKWQPEIHRASLDLGNRLSRLCVQLGWMEIEPQERLHHAIAYGIICSQLSATIEETIDSFLLTTASSMVSACVKLVPLGHTDGQRIISNLSEKIESWRQLVLLRQVADIGSFAPLYERACVEHEHLYTRIFQS